MTGFKFSRLHPPVHNIKVKKTYYRTLLGLISIALILVHYEAPDFEAQTALALNFLFVIDPTA
jgi:hypothetical protein